MNFRFCRGVLRLIFNSLYSIPENLFELSVVEFNNNNIKNAANLLRHFLLLRKTRKTIRRYKFRASQLPDSEFHILNSKMYFSLRVSNIKHLCLLIFPNGEKLWTVQFLIIREFV